MCVHHWFSFHFISELMVSPFPSLSLSLPLLPPYEYEFIRGYSCCSFKNGFPHFLFSFVEPTNGMIHIDIHMHSHIPHIYSVYTIGKWNEKNEKKSFLTRNHSSARMVLLAIRFDSVRCGWMSCTWKPWTTGNAASSSVMFQAHNEEMMWK